MVVALLGLLVPSVSLTILITACYAQIKSRPVVQEALHGVIPAAVGLGFVTAYQMARAPLKASQQEGQGSRVLGLAILVCSGLVVALWKPPVALVLCAAAGVSAVVRWRRAKRDGGEATA